MESTGISSTPYSVILAVNISTGMTPIHVCKIVFIQIGYTILNEVSKPLTFSRFLQFMHVVCTMTVKLQNLHCLVYTFTWWSSL